MTTGTYRVLAILSLGALILFLVAAGVVLLLRQGDNAPIQVLAPESGGSQRGLGAPAALSASGTALRVYVNGAVQRPGVYVLQPGDRLVEALAAAGGALPEADLAAVNLARRVQDEGYYYVPRVGEKPPPLAEAGPAAVQDQTQPQARPAAIPLVDINTAPASALESLPGIGPKLAQAIVDHRTQNGPFQSPHDITRVRGIGTGIYEQVQHLITVSAGP